MHTMFEYYSIWMKLYFNNFKLPWYHLDDDKNIWISSKFVFNYYFWINSNMCIQYLNKFIILQNKCNNGFRICKCHFVYLKIIILNIFNYYMMYLSDVKWIFVYYMYKPVVNDIFEYYTVLIWLLYILYWSIMVSEWICIWMDLYLNQKDVMIY